MEGAQWWNATSIKHNKHTITFTAEASALCRHMQAES